MREIGLSPGQQGSKGAWTQAAVTQCIVWTLIFQSCLVSVYLGLGWQGLIRGLPSLLPVLSMLQTPLGSARRKAPLNFLPPEPLGSGVDKFPASTVHGSHMSTPPTLESHSSGMVESDTSGFSSGSDYIAELLVSHCWGGAKGGRVLQDGGLYP